MKTIKELRSTHILDNYYHFDVEAFLKSKTLRIEKARKTKIKQDGVDIETLKIDTRIIKDTDGHTDPHTNEFNPYNEGKVITVRVDKDSDPDIFDDIVEDVSNAQGLTFSIDPEAVFEVYFFRGTQLTLKVEDVDIDAEQEKQEVEETKMAHRPLMSLAKYKTFNIKDFLNDTDIYLTKAYAKNGTKQVLFDAFINQDAYVVFQVDVENFEKLPSGLLRVDGSFNSLVRDYEFDYITSTNYGTKWTLHFKSITFNGTELGAHEPIIVSKAKRIKNEVEADAQPHQF